MRFQPILSPTTIGLEGDLHEDCSLHLFDDDAMHTIALLGKDAEVEFVVHLDKHL